MKIRLGYVGHGWQEGASRTHYRVATLLAVFICVDKSTERRAERRQKTKVLLENDRVGQRIEITGKGDEIKSLIKLLVRMMQIS